MDALLSPVQTTYKAAAPTEADRKLAAAGAAASDTRPAFTASSADEALAVLRNEPDYATLVAVLRYLLAEKQQQQQQQVDTTDIRQPTPLSAQLVHVLVTEIVPNYWALLWDESQPAKRKSTKRIQSGGGGGGRTDLECLLACLRSVTGLSALVARLRALLAAARAAGSGSGSGSARTSEQGSPLWELRVLLDLLTALLDGDEAVADAWIASTPPHKADKDDGGSGEKQRRLLALEFASLVGGGRIVSLAAEAEAVVRAERRGAGEPRAPAWIASGRLYSTWLVRNILRWAVRRGSDDARPGDHALQGVLLGKALRLGYPDAVVSTLVTDLVLVDDAQPDGALARLLDALPAHEQKKIVGGVLTWAADTYFGPAGGAFGADTTAVDDAVVAAVAGLVRRVVGDSPARREMLVSWLLTDAAVDCGAGGGGIGVRRAAVAVAAEDRRALPEVLDKALAEFGDQLFVKHASVLQQEAKAQVLLLAAGYVSRDAPRSLASLLRSRTYLAAVSNRLGASQSRARFLGMVVGEALSGLIDDGAKRLDFHMDETATAEAQWYKALVRVSDAAGSVARLRLATPRSSSSSSSSSSSRTDGAGPADPADPAGEAHETRQASRGGKAARPRRQAARGPAVPPKSGFVIEEVDSEDEGKRGGKEGTDSDSEEDDEDDALGAYAKPDSDAEDSDDDPTLVRRDKPKAPVYVRDLLAYLRDTESYDKQALGLGAAAVLIRRKATFGTEVQQHAAELASVLVGLADAFELADFDAQRLEAMVALVVAQPAAVAPWYAQAVFAGDYSLAQRASVLTALGLAARELAGLDTSAHAAAAAFPSKQLPARVARLYEGGEEDGSSGNTNPSLKALAPGALDSIAGALTARFLGPLAAKAADEATGPDVLKLASFQARVRDTKRKNNPPPARSNTAGALLATAFFFPLTARFQLALQASSSSSSLRGRRPGGRGGGGGVVLSEPSLLALFIKTAAVVLHAAGPGAVALPDMTAELWRLVLSSSVQAQCAGDVLVTHAVLFALLALLDANEDRMRAVCRDLPREVVQTRDWVAQVLERSRVAGGGGSSSGALGSGALGSGAPDSAAAPGAGSPEAEVPMLAAGTYMRLTEGMESYKSYLLGEMIG